MPKKTYETVLRLGLVTDTQDITGRVLEQRDAASVTEADVRAVLPRFLGPQKQVPPMYSAIKIGGKKLYELARAGQEVARPARDITIHALELLSCAPPDFTLRVHCSEGTYVRTLCHDLGAALGTGGCMAALGARRPEPIRRHRPCRWRTFWPTLRRSPCCCRSTRCLRPILR